jgi:transcriptional regulator with XRE-family HTH domain
MNIRELVLEALHTLETDQAGLAKRLGRSQATVSRWLSGDSTPDYESCLRLARIIGVPAHQVLQAAAYDTSLVADTPPSRPDPRWANFVAEIEARWRAMDEQMREVAERTTLAVFNVPPAQRRSIGRQDRTSNRRKATLRKLEERRANGQNGPETADYTVVSRPESIVPGSAFGRSNGLVASMPAL